MFGDTCWLCLKWLDYYLFILFSLAYPFHCASILLFVFFFSMIIKNRCEQIRRHLFILIK